MNASEVIESYVHDVALRLPRAKRSDVAFELRSLLGDELAAKAQSAGRAPDKAMAMDLLKSFGRPAEAASRYHQRSAIIEQTDTHHFLIWTLAGGVTISVLSLMSTPGREEMIGRFLNWIGLLAVVFAIMGWVRRQKAPGSFTWKPKRVSDIDRANRFVSAVLGLLTLIPFFAYLAPKAFTETAFFGKVTTSGLGLDPTFEWSPLRLATIAALGVHSAVYAWLVIEGRWQRWTRWTFIGVMAALGLLMGVHSGLATQGLVFDSATANERAVPFFGLVGAITIVGAIYDIYQEWSRITPAPALDMNRNEVPFGDAGH